ncbi:hypothetical protein, partial [Streptomyces eurythermus]
VFYVDTLDYLRRGGRIGAAQKRGRASARTSFHCRPGRLTCHPFRGFPMMPTGCRSPSTGMVPMARPGSHPSALETADGRDTGRVATPVIRAAEAEPVR